MRQLVTGGLIVAAFCAAFASVGIVTVMARRPVPYETPAGREGRDLPVQMRPRPPAVTGASEDLLTLDGAAVHGVAQPYRWDDAILRRLSRHQDDDLRLDGRPPLDLDELVPGSFLDGCDDGEPTEPPRPQGEAGPPPVSAGSAVPEPAPGLVMSVALALVTVWAVVTARGGEPPSLP